MDIDDDNMDIDIIEISESDGEAEQHINVDQQLDLGDQYDTNRITFDNNLDNKNTRTESNISNLRTEATTPNIFGTNNTIVNTMNTDISVNDISQDERLAFANLNDEDLNIISNVGKDNKRKDEDEISVKDI